MLGKRLLTYRYKRKISTPTCRVQRRGNAEVQRRFSNVRCRFLNLVVLLVLNMRPLLERQQCETTVPRGLHTEKIHILKTSPVPQRSTPSRSRFALSMTNIKGPSHTQPLSIGRIAAPEDTHGRSNGHRGDGRTECPPNPWERGPGRRLTVRFCGNLVDTGVQEVSYHHILQPEA